MHFGEEIHKRPKAPGGDAEEFFGGVYLDYSRHDRVKRKPADGESQNHSGGVKIFPVCLSLFRNKTPKAVYVFIHILICSALGQINLYRLDKAAAEDISENSRGQKDREGQEKAQNREPFFIEIINHNKGSEECGLEFAAESKTEKDKGRNIFFLIKTIKGHEQEKAVYGIALTPKAGIEENGGEHKNDGVNEIMLKGEPLKTAHFPNKVGGEKGKKIVENNGKQLIKTHAVNFKIC